MVRFACVVATLLLTAACKDTVRGSEKVAPVCDMNGPPAKRSPVTEPSCVDDARLQSLLASAWRPQGDQRITLLTCTAGKFPSPGWFVVAWLDTGDEPDFPERSQLRMEIVDKDGRVLASNTPKNVELSDRTMFSNYSDAQATDFDGDGTDEIAVNDHFDVHSAAGTELLVIARDGSKLVEALRAPIRFEEEDMGEPVASCSATVSFGPGRIVLYGTRRVAATASDAAKDMCFEGEKVLVKHGTVFVEKGR